MIFVSVASFVDPYLLFTVKDAVKKAKHPERLVFGIVDQNTFNRRDNVKLVLGDAKMRYMHCSPIDSRGVCWARSIAFSLYQGEEYLLQIDSHMFFDQDWDEKLIQQLADLKSKSTKPLVTNYPYGFEFIDGEPIISIQDSGQTTLVLRPHPDTDLYENDATLRFHSEHVFIREPIKGGHIAGGFLFTLGSFVYEVPYDPYLYFHGEEQSLAIRAFTRGWDIYHIPEIPLYHLYKRPGEDHNNHHWHESWEKQRDYKWIELQESAKNRLVDLVYNQSLVGSFGLGFERTLKDFAELTGIDYVERKIINKSFALSYVV